VEYISICGICEDVRHFLQHSCNVIINSHNDQMKLHTDSPASDSGAVRRERRAILGAKFNQLYGETDISESVRNRADT
jgi:hypothetical protein